MIEELGVIKAVDQDHIWVETQIKTTCGGCSVNQDCGTGVVARGLSSKSQLLIFRCDKPARIGQQVKLGIPEEDLLGASALMYLLPLVILLVSVALGGLLLPQLGLEHELWSALLAAVFTGLGFWQIRRYLQSVKRSQYQPRLLELLPYRGQSLDVVQVTGK